MRYVVTIGEQELEVEVTPEGVEVDGEAVDVELSPVGGSVLQSLLVDGRSFALTARKAGRGSWSLGIGGRELEVEVVDERTRAVRAMTGAAAGKGGPAPVRAPMPGLVVKIEVAVGDAVEPGETVAVVEAMKMENELRASAPGTVSAVRVGEGDAVEKDQVLLELDPPDSE
jgi:pyruvate carboxylase subunit B